MLKVLFVVVVTLALATASAVAAYRAVRRPGLPIGRGVALAALVPVAASAAHMIMHVSLSALSYDGICTGFPDQEWPCSFSAFVENGAALIFIFSLLFFLVYVLAAVAGFASGLWTRRRAAPGEPGPGR
jgi:hypothetical protein